MSYIHTHKFKHTNIQACSNSDLPPVIAGGIMSGVVDGMLIGGGRCGAAAPENKI